MRWAALALGGLAACGGTTGTYQLELVTAPGSTVLDGVARARLTLSLPYRQVEAERGGDGKFHLELEVAAEGPSGFVTFEGLDAGGAAVAWGRSGPLPIAAIEAAIAIYVAAPQSLAAAPVALEPPRAALGVGAFEFGALLVGGTSADGAPSAAVSAYNLYGHQLLVGEDLPAPRAAPAVAASGSGYGYVLGGRGPDGPTGTLWRFDTTVAPRGLWEVLDDEAGLARAGAATAEVGPELFLATGNPVAIIDGRSRTVSATTTLPALAGTASAIEVDGLAYALFVGDGSGATGVVRLAPTGVTEETSASARRTGHGAAVTFDRRVVVLGGAVDGVLTRAALVVDPVANTYQEVADALATARRGAAVASAGDVIVVAGGRDQAGAIVPDAEVLDARTLAPIATVPMVAPRADAAAVVLANDQILIAGGVDAAGAPVATLELYTAAVF